MRKICAWCKKDLGIVPTVNNSDGIVSHGICEECVDRILAQQGIRQGCFLDVTVLMAVVDAKRRPNWTAPKMISTHASINKYSIALALLILSCTSWPLFI